MSSGIFFAYFGTMKKHYLLFSFLFLLLNLRAQITCDFTLADSSGCCPFAILATATGTSASPIVARRWYVTGPGPASCNFVAPPGLNPNLSYVVCCPGNYCIRLWSQNQNGDTCSITKCVVNVYATPVINFTFSPTPLQGCLPLSFTVQDNSTPGSGVITSTSIDWGCGTASFFPPSTFPFTKTYNSCPTGCIDPTVIVCNSFGCCTDTTYSCLAEIIDTPTAFFTADITFANCSPVPLTSHFTADSAGPNMEYKWFIDGVLTQTSTSRFFTHSFTASGSCYDIMLVVSHSSGCADTFTRNNYICFNPAVSYTQNPTAMCDSGYLTLTNTTPGIDSLVFTVTGPQNFGPVKAHSTIFFITQPGTYTIKAVGKFSPTCSDSAFSSLSVVQGVSADFFISDTFHCSVPATVNFAANPCAGCAHAWSLFSGSPSSSSSASPTVTYTGFGLKIVRHIAIGSNGCADTLVKQVLIQKINPHIAIDHIAGCAPVCATLSDITNYNLIPEPIASVCWSFPGSNIPGACQDTVQRCFPNIGCYDVRLTVTTTTGCVDSTSLIDTICVGSPPLCAMTLSPLTMCYESDTVVASLSCNTFDFAEVNWGDGSPVQTFYTPVFTHVFRDTGILTVTVTPYKDSCIGNVMTQQVTIYGPVSAFHDSAGCVSGDTLFLVNDSKGATSYQWNLCNGTTSTQTNLAVVIPLCTVCDVTLTTFNSTTVCSHSYTRTVITPCYSASFSPTDTTICVGRNVNFTNTSVNNTPQFTRWDFDCGNGILFSGPSSNSVTRTFTSTGNFCVAMRNKTNFGCEDTAYGNVTVCRAYADFSFNNNCNSNSVCFNDATRDTFCTLSTWDWDFGDNTPHSSLQNPCHTYANGGAHNITLVVTNSAGCPSMITKQVTIVTGDVADKNICAQESWCIASLPNISGLSFAWNIPAATYTTGTTNTSALPCIQINTQGDFLSTVVVSDTSGCSFTDSFTVHVNQVQAAGNVSADTIFCADGQETVAFYDQSQGNPDTWLWSFGDGTTSANVSPQHTYTMPGCYHATLSSCKGACCSNVVIDTICGYQIAANFIYNQHSDSFAFLNTSTGSYEASAWSFGDGGNSSAQDPVHVYSTPGLYTVTLVITDVNAPCSDTFISQITVAPFVSIHETDEGASGFSIYPNPSKDNFTVSVSENFIGKTLTVTDVTGKRVATVQLKAVNKKLETVGWTRGIYFVRVGNVVRKLAIE